MRAKHMKNLCIHSLWNIIEISLWKFQRFMVWCSINKKWKKKDSLLISFSEFHPVTHLFNPSGNNVITLF